MIIEIQNIAQNIIRNWHIPLMFSTKPEKMASSSLRILSLFQNQELLHPMKLKSSLPLTIFACALLGITSQIKAANIIIDISGVESFDVKGQPANTILNVDLAAALGGATGQDVIITGVGWDTVYSSIGASWGSEATIELSWIDFSTGLGTGVSFAPSATSDPVANEANSQAIINLVAVGIGNGLVSGGVGSIEFWEGWNDAAGADGVFEAGSTITIEAELVAAAPPIPEPGAAALFSLAAGVLLLRRRR